MSKENGRRFILIGCGGTGTWLSMGLARMAEYGIDGKCALILVDGDSYEPKNVERQQFYALGNKAEVKAEELAPQFPNTFIMAEPSFVVEEAEEGVEGIISATDLIEEGDVIYTAVDNFAARKAVFDAAQALDNVDVFTGGNDDALFGSTYHYKRRDGVDVTPHPGVFHDEFVNPPDKNPGDMNCQERMEEEGSVQLLATNMAVASLLLGRTKKTIIDGEEDEEAEIYFDLGVGKMVGYDRVPQEVTVEADGGLAV